MSRKINVTILEGNLGTEPERHDFASGGKVVSFSVCGSAGGKKDPATGQWEDKSVWMTVKVFGSEKNKQADFCAENLKKGSRVIVQGHLEEENWQTKEGQKRSKVVLIADNVSLADRGKKQEEPKEGAQAASDIPF